MSQGSLGRKSGFGTKITIDVLQSLMDEQSVPAIILFDPLDILRCLRRVVNAVPRGYDHMVIQPWPSQSKSPRYIL